MAPNVEDDETFVHRSRFSMSCTGLLSKSQRLLLGLVILLLVDVIWVLSSELTKVYSIPFMSIFQNFNETIIFQ